MSNIMQLLGYMQFVDSYQSNFGQVTEIQGIFQWVEKQMGGEREESINLDDIFQFQ
jgi:hypothetical protein